MRHIDDHERRSRLGTRHALAAGHRAADPLAATRAVGVLHATEPATVYLSLHARVEALTVADVDRALYADRSLVKQLAMRRTLFVFPRELLPAAWGSASARVAAQLGARLAKEVEAAGITDDGVAWLETARAAVLDRLAGDGELSTQELRERVPELEGRLDLSPGKPYAANVPVAPRVLTQLGVEGAVVRGSNGGHWRISRPRWTRTEAWLGDLPTPAKSDEGYAALVAAWLAAFGPGTAADLQWWLGGTTTAVKRALAEVGAVQVSLDAAGDGPDRPVGWVLPDDEPGPEPEPWAALLPVLDPTVMGWKERRFFLGPHGETIFDRNGNAGSTAWWAARVVGCWVQDAEGVVHLSLLEEVPDEGRDALAAEADRLTAWLDGTRVSTVYTSPAMKAAAAGLRGGPAQRMGGKGT